MTATQITNMIESCRKNAEVADQIKEYGQCELCGKPAIPGTQCLNESIYHDTDD